MRRLPVCRRRATRCAWSLCPKPLPTANLRSRRMTSCARCSRGGFAPTSPWRRCSTEDWVSPGQLASACVARRSLRRLPHASPRPRSRQMRGVPRRRPRPAATPIDGIPRRRRNLSRVPSGASRPPFRLTAHESRRPRRNRQPADFPGATGRRRRPLRSGFRTTASCRKARPPAGPSRRSPPRLRRLPFPP